MELIAEPVQSTGQPVACETTFHLEHFNTYTTFTTREPFVTALPTPIVKNFDQPILFIAEVKNSPLDEKLPFLYNNRGVGEQKTEQCGDLIVIEPTDPHRMLGQQYENVTCVPKTINPGKPNAYEIGSFNFHTDEVVYQPLPATRETVRAFGMTLLRDKECVRFPYRGLDMNVYLYGQWAAYQSPYLEPERRLELLPRNPTDLEFHNFAHVFFSHGQLPLVISVARWRPHQRRIWLADLWLEPGDAIVLPPQPTPGLIGPDTVIDLHGNRNSALACRFHDGVPHLLTTTILGNEAVMQNPATRAHYFEEITPTRHLRLR
jgi:hypothetical protein